MHLSNPVLAFVAVWGVTLWLFSLRLTNQLLPLNFATVALVGANMLTGIVLYVPMSLYFRKRQQETVVDTTHGELEVLQTWTRRLTVVWAVGSAIEVIVARGVPLLWIVMGNGRTYVEFGIPMFHGFMQAIYMFVLTGVFLEGMLTRKRSRFVWTGLLMLWSVLQVNRGSLMWSIFEIAAVWLVLRPIRTRQLFLLMLGGIAVAFIFGAIGDIRSKYSSDVIRLILTERGLRVFDFLPISTAWIYLYITSPINNLGAVLDKIHPTHVPYFSTMLLFPSGLRSTMFTGNFGADPGITLVDDAFNTWTIYLNFLLDWGFSGAIFTIALLQGLATYFHLLARRGELWAILGYAAFFQAIVLSVFADSFTTLVAVAQILLATFFGVAVAHARRTFRAPAERVRAEFDSPLVGP